MKVNEADKAAFIAASKAVYEEFSKEVPGGKEADRQGARARPQVVLNARPSLRAGPTGRPFRVARKVRGFFP